MNERIKDLTESELEAEIQRLTPILETNKIARIIVGLFQKELDKKRNRSNQKEIKSKLGYSRIGMRNI